MINTKKLLSLLLCLIMVFSLTLPVGATTAANETETLDSGKSFQLTGPGETNTSSEIPIGTEFSTIGSDRILDTRTLQSSSATGAYYDQLTTRGKAFFDAMKSQTIDILSGVTKDKSGYSYVSLAIQGVYGEKLPGTISGSTFKYTAEGTKIEKEIYTDLYAAVAAFRYDRPDYFWTSKMMTGYDYSIDAKTSQLTIKNFRLGFMLEFGGKEKEIFNTTKENVDAIAAEARKRSTTFAQILFVHDVINYISSYSKITDSTVSKYPFIPYSALVPGDSYEPVCEGYSKAMRLVCEKLGISCILAISKEHMWNNVKLDDGNWYNLDLTWDDTGTDSYAYFLVGDETKVSGTAFNQQTDHKELDIYTAMIASDSYDISFDYPVKSKDEYTYKYTAAFDPGIPAFVETLKPIFTDVSKSQWYYDAVVYVYDDGLFGGTTDITFSPGVAMTRAMFVKVLSNHTENTADSSISQLFDDVKPGIWYYDSVQWAAENKIVDGYGNGKFKPMSSITREQMAVMLYNYAVKTGTDVTVKGEKHVNYTDFNKVSSWAKDAMIWAIDREIIKGVSTTMLYPKNTANRAQVATIFMNASGKINNEII